MFFVLAASHFGVAQPTVIPSSHPFQPSSIATFLAVIGVPDVEAGELPKAFVVRKGDVTADEVMAFVAENVAPYKKIRFVEFVEQIPKSSSGKILRRLLKEKEA